MNAWLPFIALVKRELLSSLRRTRTFFLVAGVSVLVVGWFLNSVIGMAAGNAQADYLLDVFLQALLLVTLVIVPPLAAISVCEEKQRETFDLLSTSLIRPSGIVLGKLVNALGLYVLVLIALLPVVGVLFFFVGIDFTQFGIVVVALLVTAFSCGSVGIFCSVYSRNPFKSIVLSYLVIVLLFMFACGTPFSAFASGNSFVSLLAVGPPVLVGCLFLVRATFALRRPPRLASVNPHKPIDDPALLRARRRNFPYYLVDPLRRKPVIADNQSAVYRREMQTSPFSQAAFRIRTGYVYFILTFPFSLPLFFQPGDISPVLLYAHTCILCALAPALTATLMVKEYEQENADMLRMTLLSPREILSGKISAGLSFLVPMITACMLLSFPSFLLVFRTDWFPLFITAYVTMANALVQVVVLAFTATLFCRRTTTALFAAYGTTGFLLILLPAGVLNLLVQDNVFKAIFRADIEHVPLVLQVLFGLFPSPLVLQFLIVKGVFGGDVLNMAWFTNQITTAASSAALFFGGVRYYEKRLLRDR